MQLYSFPLQTHVGCSRPTNIVTHLVVHRQTWCVTQFQVWPHPICTRISPIVVRACMLFPSICCPSRVDRAWQLNTSQFRYPLLGQFSIEYPHSLIDSWAHPFAQLRCPRYLPTNQSISTSLVPGLLFLATFTALMALTIPTGWTQSSGCLATGNPWRWAITTGSGVRYFDVLGSPAERSACYPSGYQPTSGLVYAADGCPDGFTSACPKASNGFAWTICCPT